MNERQKQIIENYLKAYNNFNVIGMIENLSNEVVFENISNGKITLRTEGLEAFKSQAEEAKKYFNERKQNVESWSFEGAKARIDINYKAVLAIDLPNGLKAGDSLELKGESEFEFENGRIISIKDMS